MTFGFITRPLDFAHPAERFIVLEDKAVGIYEVHDRIDLPGTGVTDVVGVFDSMGKADTYRKRLQDEAHREVAERFRGAFI